MKRDSSKFFRWFADGECKKEPLYVELCVRSAGDAQLSLLDVATVTQRRANLLLAAIHHLRCKEADHRLACYFPSVGPALDVDAKTFPVFQDFCTEYRVFDCNCAG